jgi:hypothetical protein
MLKSLFFSYLSPAWKRLVRTIAVLNCLFYGLLVILEDENYLIVPILVIANALVSYIFELFVKKNQENEILFSFVIIAFNIFLFIVMMDYF